MNRPKEKLYRKANKKALHYRDRWQRHEYRYVRHTKEMNNFEGSHKSMPKKERGLDYTPLYMFLLSKVGSKWDDVFSEAKSRLDKEEPIYHLVRLHVGEHTPKVVWCSESAQYNTLTVNEKDILIKIDEHTKPWPPLCTCCTHTFNGEVIMTKELLTIGPFTKEIKSW